MTEPRGQPFSEPKPRKVTYPPNPLGLERLEPWERIVKICDAAENVNGAPAGDLPLQMAVFTGDLSAVTKFIASGSNIHSTDSGGSGLLHIAVQYGLHRDEPDGGLTVLRLLLEAGVDANVANEDGQTPLMLAAAVGSVAAVRMLLDYGADPNRKNLSGQTAMDLATGDGRHRIKKMLRDAGGPKE